MTRSLPRDRGSVALALTTYTGLLRLYPAAFRQRFGHEMTQVFCDGCRAAWYTHGGWGVLRLWLTTLPDVVITAIKEHLASSSKRNKEIQVQASTLARLGGIMAFVAIFFQLIVQVILVVWDSGHKLIPRHVAESASQIAFALVLIGLASVQRSQVGRWLWGSIVAFILVSAFVIHPLPGIPGVLMVFEEQGSSTPLIWSAVYELAIVIAMAVASIVTLRAHVLGRWSVSPLLMTTWMVLSLVVIPLVTSAIDIRFQGQIDRSGEGYVKQLLDILVVVPGCLFLLGTGIGLLQLASQSAPTPAPTSAIAEATQGK